jgi:YD repeat-containing protein
MIHAEIVLRKYCRWNADFGRGSMIRGRMRSKKRTTKSLGEIDLSKNPVHDSFLVPFCRDPYQRLTDNTKIFSNTVCLEFDGEVKNVSVYLLRSQAMSRTNYNDKGQVQSQIDARGNSLAYKYNDFGRQSAIIREGEERSCCS